MWFEVIKFPRVIIITGTPGVGKTAVSKTLTERLRGLYINLTDLAIGGGLVSTASSEEDTAVADLDKLSDKISQIIGGTSLDVVVDGHYASDVVSPDLVSYAFVLRLDPDVLGERLRARAYVEKKVLENVASEVLDVCLVDAVSVYGLEKVDEIDVTEMRVEEVVEEILKVLSGGRRPTVGGVDWLGKLDEDGRLDRTLALLDRV